MAESTFPRLLLVKKYPLALLAMKDRIRDCGVLRMSNRACSSGENAGMYKIMTFYEFYEYQIALVAVGKTR